MGLSGVFSAGGGGALRLVKVFKAAQGSTDSTREPDVPKVGIIQGPQELPRL